MKTLAILIMVLLATTAMAGDAPRWKVTWEVVTTFAVACSEPEPVPDEFGRVQPRNTMTLQACWEERITKHDRLFNSKEDAEAFIERGEKQTSEPIWQYPSVRNFEIWEMK
jgi:hypothetical protein